MIEKILNRPIKVMIIDPSDPGKETSMPFIKSQVASLVKLGIEIKVFHLLSRTSPMVLLDEIVRFRTVYKSFLPDIIHAQFGSMTAFFGALVTPKPFIITYRGSDLNYSHGTLWIRNYTGRIISQLAALRANKIICVSEELRNRLWLRHSITEVIPSGIDLELFSPKPMAEARARLGWSMEDKVVLFNTGNNPIGKRLDLAQSAISIAQMELPNLKLFVFEGKTPVNQMPWYYSAADCLLLTSDYEGSPNVVKEALACNTPIVSVDVGDVAQRLQGVSHCNIVSRNASAIANAIVLIVKAKHRSNGRESIKNISLENMAQKVIDTYKCVIAKHAKSI